MKSLQRIEIQGSFERYTRHYSKTVLNEWRKPWTNNELRRGRRRLDCSAAVAGKTRMKMIILWSRKLLQLWVSLRFQTLFPATYFYGIYVFLEDLFVLFCKINFKKLRKSFAFVEQKKLLVDPHQLSNSNVKKGTLPPNFCPPFGLVRWQPKFSRAGSLIKVLRTQTH